MHPLFLSLSLHLSLFLRSITDRHICLKFVTPTNSIRSLDRPICRSRFFHLLFRFGCTVCVCVCGKRDAAASCMATVIDLTTCLKSAIDGCIVYFTCSFLLNRSTSRMHLFMFTWTRHLVSIGVGVLCARDHYLMHGQIKMKKPEITFFPPGTSIDPSLYLFLNDGKIRSEC